MSMVDLGLLCGVMMNFVLNLMCMCDLGLLNHIFYFYVVFVFWVFIVCSSMFLEFSSCFGFVFIVSVFCSFERTLRVPTQNSRIFKLVTVAAYNSFLRVDLN